MQEGPTIIQHESDGVVHQFVLPGSGSHLVPSSSVTATVRYRFTSRFSGGVHYDPRAKHIGPVANFLAMGETSTRPALVFGTSADRIGLPHGQAFYTSISKNLKTETGLPIAPYAGVAYGTYDQRLRSISGLNVAFNHRLGSLLIFDGVNIHPVVNLSHHSQIFSFILVRGRHPGMSYSISF